MKIYNRCTGELIGEFDALNLQDADLQNAALQKANLRGADLQNADLRSASLQDANLQGADLRDANLQNADLSGADLRDASLQDANLQGADLRDANLQGANLMRANLISADLLGADLRNAKFRGATLSDKKSSPAKDSIDFDKVKVLQQEILAIEAEINSLYAKRKAKIAELVKEQIDPNITPEDLLIVAANCGDLLRKYPEPKED